MPRFRHRRTGRIEDVPAELAARYRPPRWEPLEGSEVKLEKINPDWTVAQVLAWAGGDPLRRSQALAAEKAGKNRKGVIEGLS